MPEGYSYSMNEAVNVANLAYSDIEKYLNRFNETIKITNVENDEFYREKDIDMIWERNVDGVQQQITIEIKGDRYHHTGNLFFETISNDKKNTPGCFLYTEANYLFYYFVYSKELHILPMPETRNWFLENEHLYTKTVKTSTVNNAGEFMYNTLGKLLPKKDLREASIPGYKIVKLKKSLK